MRIGPPTTSWVPSAASARLRSFRDVPTTTKSRLPWAWMGIASSLTGPTAPATAARSNTPWPAAARRRS